VIARARSWNLKNKTQKKLTAKKHSSINLPVTRVAAFETDKGTATDVVTHGRGNEQAAVDSTDALSRSRKALLERPKGFSSYSDQNE